MEVTQLEVDEEFAALIPRLSESEFAILRQSIVSSGKCDAIHVWSEVIVDGHHRYRICQEEGIHFEVISHQFKDRKEAKEWMLRNQLGRRNLGRIASSVLRGHLYKQLRMSNGGIRQRRTDKTVDKHNTEHALAKILGVAPSTIRSDVHISEAVDRLCDKAREYVLCPDSRARKQNVIDLSCLSHDAQESVIEAIENSVVSNLRAAISRLRPKAVAGHHSIRCRGCGAKLAPGVTTCLKCDLEDSDVRKALGTVSGNCDTALELDDDAKIRLEELRRIKAADDGELEWHAQWIKGFLEQTPVAYNSKPHKILGRLWRDIRDGLPKRKLTA